CQRSRIGVTCCTHHGIEIYLRGLRVTVVEISQSFINIRQATHTLYPSIIDIGQSLKQCRKTITLLVSEPEIVFFLRSINGGEAWRKFWIELRIVIKS